MPKTKTKRGLKTSKTNSGAQMYMSHNAKKTNLGISKRISRAARDTAAAGADPKKMGKMSASTTLDMIERKHRKGK